MQGNHLGTEEVLAVRDARRDVNEVVAAVGDDGAGAPLAVVVAVLLDLEPTPTDSRVGQGVADLLEVGQRRALVAGVHDVAGARGERVPPDGLDGGARGDGDDLVGLHGRVRAAIAGQVVGGDVGDGAVVGRGPDGVGYRVYRAACVELDEDGVGRSRRGSGQEREGLHCGFEGVDKGHNIFTTEQNVDAREGDRGLYIRVQPGSHS